MISAFAGCIRSFGVCHPSYLLNLHEKPAGFHHTTRGSLPNKTAWSLVHEGGLADHLEDGRIMYSIA